MVAKHSRSKYIHDGCRCRVCTAANRKWATEYSRERNRQLGITRVDATAARERLRALAWMGWSTRALAEKYQASTRTLDGVRQGRCETVRRGTHNLVHRMFEDLCLTQAPGNGGNIARALARKNNWPSPMSVA